MSEEQRKWYEISGVPSDSEVLAMAEPLAGWMYPEELLWLFRQARLMQTVVEFGTWQGRSTVAMALGARHVYTCDHWRGSSEELEAAHSSMVMASGREACFLAAMRNLASFVARGRVTVVHADHLHAGDVLAGYVGWRSCGMVFLDGGHDYASVTQNITTAARLISPRGLICGHDISWPGVEAAVKEMFGDHWERGPGSIWYVPDPIWVRTVSV